MNTRMLCLALLPIILGKVQAQTYNALWIPPMLTGPTFNLSLSQTNKQFFPGAKTVTYAYNGAEFWGPTLIMNKGDVVQLNVANNLIDTTTTHWHGFHIPAIMDGGPHQTIPAGTTWSPMFTVLNNASTFWYHPHLHEKTQDQLTHGAGGMIVIRDAQEAALALPRTYGVDDFPLALSSRRFNAAGPNVNQFCTTNCAYGDYAVVNGTMNAQVSLPAQYVRLRILNAEIERSYNLGFSDNRTFHVIGTDGGLVNAPVAMNRALLAVGERLEVLLDLTADAVGSTLDLMAYNSGQQPNFPGGEPNTNGRFGSLLNNTNFTLLHMVVTNTTTNPITSRPAVLATNSFWTTNDVTNTRTISFLGGTNGTVFTFDNTVFALNVINQTVNLNAVEKWTLTNNSSFSHSFHVHDVQFNLISRVSRSGGIGGIASYEQGWKDTVYVERGSSVSFIAKFDGFASPSNPFMYHCHFSNHEDEGTMNQFLVVNNAVEDLGIASFTRTGTNSYTGTNETGQAYSNIALQFRSTVGTTYTLQFSTDMTTGSWADVGSVTSDGSMANFVETDAARLAIPRVFYRVKMPKTPYYP